MSQVLDEHLQSQRLLNSREMAAIFNVKVETFQGWVRKKSPELEGCPHHLTFGERTRRWPFAAVMAWKEAKTEEEAAPGPVANDSAADPSQSAAKSRSKTT